MASRNSGKAKGTSKAKAVKGPSGKGKRGVAGAAKATRRPARPSKTPARTRVVRTRRTEAPAASDRSTPLATAARRELPAPSTATTKQRSPLREQVLDRMRQTLIAKRRDLVSGMRESSLESIRAGAEDIQDIADQASTAYTKEFLLSISDTERRLLQQVEDALDKIRRKTYGLCEKCGEPVGEKRLEALPFAKLCIRCQEEEEERR